MIKSNKRGILFFKLKIKNDYIKISDNTKVIKLAVNHIFIDDSLKLLKTLTY